MVHIFHGLHIATRLKVWIIHSLKKRPSSCLWLHFLLDELAGKTNVPDGPLSHLLAADHLLSLSCTQCCGCCTQCPQNLHQSCGGNVIPNAVHESWTALVIPIYSVDVMANIDEAASLPPVISLGTCIFEVVDHPIRFCTHLLLVCAIVCASAVSTIFKTMPGISETDSPRQNNLQTNGPWNATIVCYSPSFRIRAQASQGHASGSA